MGTNTIECSLWLMEEKELEMALCFLFDRGIGLGKDPRNSSIFIECKEKPAIFNKLEKNLYKVGISSNSNSEWLLRINEHGASIYLAHTCGDGSVFIPTENITAIHTVDDAFLGNIKHHANEQMDTAQRLAKETPQLRIGLLDNEIFELSFLNWLDSLTAKQESDVLPLYLRGSSSLGLKIGSLKKYFIENIFSQ